MATTSTGCTALVTGSTSGIGRAVARQLAVLGADIVVHGRSADRGTRVIREIESLGVSARLIAADLTHPYILVQQLVPDMAARGCCAVVRAAAVQMSPVLYSRDATVAKVVGTIDELGRAGCNSPPSPRRWFPTIRTSPSCSVHSRWSADYSRHKLPQAVG